MSLNKTMKIGLSNEDKQNMADEISAKIKQNFDDYKENIDSDLEDFKNKTENTIEAIGDLKPSGTALEDEILAFQENKGIYVSTDTGHWFYWNDFMQNYADGGQYVSEVEVEAPVSVVTINWDGVSSSFDSGTHTNDFEKDDVILKVIVNNDVENVIYCRRFALDNNDDIFIGSYNDEIIEFRIIDGNLYHVYYLNKDILKQYDITFKYGYGIKCQTTNSSFGFDDEGMPCIVNGDGSLVVSVAKDNLTGTYNRYTFPDKNGTIALEEDVKKYIKNIEYDSTSFKITYSHGDNINHEITLPFSDFLEVYKSDDTSSSSITHTANGLTHSVRYNDDEDYIGFSSTKNNFRAYSISPNHGVDDENYYNELIVDSAKVLLSSYLGSDVNSIEVNHDGVTINGSTHITGDLIVDGNTTNIATENLKVKDKIIEVAKDNTTELVGMAGVVVPKYDGVNAGGILFDKTGTAYVGDLDNYSDSESVLKEENPSLQPILTRDESLVDGNFLRWDATLKKATDSGLGEKDFREAMQEVKCNHEYEITGNTGDEHGLAVKDQQMLLKRIEGQTGRYSENEFNIQDVAETTENGTTFSITNQTIKINKPTTTENEFEKYIYFDKPIILKANTPYTFYRSVGWKGNINISNTTIGSTATFQLGWHIKILTKTFEQQITVNRFYIDITSDGIADNITSNIMLLEGTYTEDTIPVFKPYDNTLVNAKCNFISTGRNLFDGLWEFGTISAETGELINSSNQIRSVNYIPINPKLTYYCSLQETALHKFRFYDYQKNYIASNTPSFTGTNGPFGNVGRPIPTNACYLKITIDISNLNFKESISVNDYIDYDTPYIENSITYNRELTAYGYHDNETNITYEYGNTMLINGSENWIEATNSYPYDVFIHQSLGQILGTNVIINSSRFTFYPYWHMEANSIYANGNQLIFVLDTPQRTTTLEEFKTYLQQNPISLVYKQSTPRYTIEEYLPNGYDVYNGGMQIQSIEGKYLPYNLTKVYSVSIADQLTANRVIDKGQQEQIDEVKNKASILEQDKLNAKTDKGYDNTEIINNGESIVIKKHVDDTSTINRITVDSNKIEIYNHNNDEGITKKIVMDDGGITLSIDDNGETSTFNINKNLTTITSPSINLNGVDIGSQGYINVLGDATLNNGLNVPNGDVVITNGIDAGMVYVQNFDSEWTNVASKVSVDMKATLLKFTNVTVSFTADSLYSDYPYKGNIVLSEITSNMSAEIIFNLTDSISGNYAPICETYDGGIYIWAKTNTQITIPLIKVVY